MLPTGRTRSGSAAVEGGGVGWLAAALLSYILSEADHRLSEVEPPREVTVSFWVEARRKWGRPPFKRSSGQTNVSFLRLHLVQQQPQGQEAHSIGFFLGPAHASGPYLESPSDGVFCAIAGCIGCLLRFLPDLQGEHLHLVCPRSLSILLALPWYFCYNVCGDDRYRRGRLIVGCEPGRLRPRKPRSKPKNANTMANNWAPVAVAA